MTTRFDAFDHLATDTDFGGVHNHHERDVFERVQALGPRYALVTTAQWPDVACVALNRLPPRYIRHAVDYAFYRTEASRAEARALVDEAVRYGFEYVQARTVMKAR